MSAAPLQLHRPAKRPSRALDCLPRCAAPLQIRQRYQPPQTRRFSLPAVCKSRRTTEAHEPIDPGRRATTAAAAPHPVRTKLMWQSTGVAEARLGAGLLPRRRWRPQQYGKQKAGEGAAAKQQSPAMPRRAPPPGSVRCPCPVDRGAPKSRKEKNH